MNVSAAVDNKCRAIPCRRCVEGTKSRDIPIGVGSGVGRQKRPVLASTATRAAVDVATGSRDEFDPSGHSVRDAIAIAVEMRCAIKQPTIFSRPEVVTDGIRNRYAFESRSISGVRGGDERLRLIVSRSNVN